MEGQVGEEREKHERERRVREQEPEEKRTEIEEGNRGAKMGGRKGRADMWKKIRGHCKRRKRV